jgi:hypothetical protein
MSKSADERDLLAGDALCADSEDALIVRVASDRRAGKDTTKDVEALLDIAAEKNQAALDRLAK